MPQLPPRVGTDSTIVMSVHLSVSVRNSLTKVPWRLAGHSDLSNMCMVKGLKSNSKSLDGTHHILNHARERLSCPSVAGMSILSLRRLVLKALGGTRVVTALLGPCL